MLSLESLRRLVFLGRAVGLETVTLLEWTHVQLLRRFLVQLRGFGFEACQQFLNVCLGIERMAGKVLLDNILYASAYGS